MPYWSGCKSVLPFATKARRLRSSVARAGQLCRRALLVDACFVNRSAATITVSCALVDGSVGELGEEPGYYPLSIELGTGTAGILEWSAPDFSLPTFSTTANLSCALPPGG
jgi:hypothetical protein